MIMLKYLYRIEYINIPKDRVENPSLPWHAQICIVAQKYQVPDLEKEVYQNFLSILRPRPLKHEPIRMHGPKPPAQIRPAQAPVEEHNFVDFPVALDAIFNGTRPDCKIRKLMMRACIAGEDKLEEAADFKSLLEDQPDLALEIDRHLDVDGDWECEDSDTTIFSREDCDGLPTCPICRMINFYGECRPYEHSSAQENRDEQYWTCPPIEGASRSSRDRQARSVQIALRRPNFL